nr:aspartic proteinase-like protein 2 [Tanacetum cinerariifolium]
MSLFTVILTIFISSFLSFTRAIVDDDPTAIILRPPPSNRHVMFLPLFPTAPNISGDGKSRRRLQKSDGRHNRPNARMALHDDLLLNGYYTTRLWIGTPPQKFELIIDTGSTATYVPCSTCQQCGKHQDPKFDPESSDSYEPMKCNVDCTCDSKKRQCVYERQYAEMSSSSGVLGEDIISFGNQSDLSPQRATFGCENVETGDLYNQHADGIMGLGRGDLSLVDQLVDKGVISDTFSLCYGGMDIGGGAMVLGGISPPSGMVYAYSDPIRSPYYNIELKELHVAGKRLPLKASVFDGKHGTIMKELRSLKQIKGPDPSYNDICFSGAGSDISKLSETFPSVEMVFGKGHTLKLSPENYLFRHLRVRGAYCLGFFQNGKDPTTLLGGIIARNTFVMYDREHDKIGFWKTNCSDLWARLHPSGGPSPSPDGSNSSADMPSSSPPYHISPGSKVGNIIFYMSLNIKYSKLEPQIMELTQFIAMELDVNVSQVNLLDFTSEANGSLTIWSITPPKPAEYMSEATASNIIARIAEDEIHLPKSFGKHRISNWYIESEPNRTWWQNYKVVVMVIMLGLVFGSLGFVTWRFWRRRRQPSIPYKPVDSAVSEQELQPL